MRSFLLLLLFLSPLVLKAQQPVDVQLIIDKLEALDNVQYQSSAIQGGITGVYWSQGTLYFQKEQATHRVHLSFDTEPPFKQASREEAQDFADRFDVKNDWFPDATEMTSAPIEKAPAEPFVSNQEQILNAMHPFRGCKQVLYDGQKFIRHNQQSKLSYVDDFPTALWSFTHLYILEMLKAAYTAEAQTEILGFDTMPEAYVLTLRTKAPMQYLDGDKEPPGEGIDLVILFDKDSLLPRRLTHKSRWGFSVQTWENYNFSPSLPEEIWSENRFPEHEIFRSMRQSRDAMEYPEIGEDKVLWAGQELQGADAKSFRQLDHNYFADKNHVYFVGSIVEGADPATFTLWDYFCVDKYAVYKRNKKVEKADPRSYKWLDPLYAIDNHHVFFHDKVIEGADPHTFTRIYTPGEEQVSANNIYNKDMNHVYYHDQLLEGVDPDTFLVLAKGYAKDSTQVIKGKHIHPEWDAATFEALPRSLCKDKNGVYNPIGNKMEGIDPLSFEILNHYYSKDKNKVYWNLLPIEGADVRTFELADTSLHGSTAKDKLGNFYQGKREKQ